VIQGNQTWGAALAQPQKQALYIFQIPQFGVILASFPVSLIQPQSGYGVTLYGIGGYGT
jgi:hypothetical protein